MAAETKSSQVICPDCRQSFLVEVSHETDHLRLACPKCSESLLLPAAAFRPDERSA